LNGRNVIKLKNTEEILKYFPNSIYQILYKLFTENYNLINEVREIRIKAERPIIIRLRNRDFILEYKVSQSEMLNIIERLCENSIYAYKNQICEGFITVQGGHRVGITGTCVIENGKIINIKYISSLNFRIAREVIGCSDEYLQEILDIENNTIFNTIIVAPPGKGKTTMLRDIIRQISNGIRKMNFEGKTVGVVDERGEIAACFKGIPQNDVGVRTDVIESVSKDNGIRMLIRSMAPDIIACDEIGSIDDVTAIKYAFVSGVKGIFTVHGKNMEDLQKNEKIYELINNKQIQKIIFLNS
jgi:stage III sporulation protein AA